MTRETELRQQLSALRAGLVPDDALYGLIHDFGEAEFAESEPDVAQYLRHPKPSLRYIALNVLTFHWDMRKYRDECEWLMFEDSDPEVRGMAAAGLGFILRQSRDAEATSMLLKKLRQHDEDGMVRKCAYDALLDLWLPHRRNLEQLNRDLDEEEESIRADRRAVKLSREIDIAQTAGDEDRVRTLSAELGAIIEADKKRWEKLVDWGLVDAIERGEIPK